MADAQSTTTRTEPTCYRHPDRVTWVSCGRCGKPLCPDCVTHGPVGVRCRECLLPQGTGTSVVDETRLRKATVAAALIVAVSVVVIVLATLLAGIMTASSWAVPVWSPNVLLSMAAGGLVGWSIWRVCQRAWNTATIRRAVVAGAAIPLLAAVAIMAVLLLQFGWHPLSWLFVARTLLAAGLSALFAWLLATNSM